MLLKDALQAVALALGGRPGARLTGRLAAGVSRMTLLRLIRALPEPEISVPRVLGVDDFALRRGHHYGTVLIDVETRWPVDVLPDRPADSLADWLDAHLGVEVICQDRAGCYAEGAERGAPTEIQVADRWYLLHNLTEAVKKVVGRHRRCLRPEPEPEREPDSERPEAVALTEQWLEGPLAQRTRARHAEVHALAAKGLAVTAIGRDLGLDRKTVRRYLHAATPEELITAHPTGRTSTLNPHKNYLCQRWEEGCTSTIRLFDEIRERGFAGQHAHPAPLHRPPRRALELWGWNAHIEEFVIVVVELCCGTAVRRHRSPSSAAVRTLDRTRVAVICQIEAVGDEPIWTNRSRRDRRKTDHTRISFGIIQPADAHPQALIKKFHVHTEMDSAELPVRHQTRRQGRPCTLVLTKTDELFTCAASARHKAATGMTWLASVWDDLH